MNNDLEHGLAYLRTVPLVSRQIQTLKCDADEVIAALQAAIADYDTDRAIGVSRDIQQLIAVLLGQCASNIESYYWLYMQMKMERLESLQERLTELRRQNANTKATEQIEEMMRATDSVVSAAIAPLDPDSGR